jgi:probable HAF family extracellular repeat protein
MKRMMGKVILMTMLTMAVAAMGLVQPLFAWEEYSIIDLGTLPGGTFSGASAINESGQIIGFADNESGEQRAVLWIKQDSHWDDED